MADKKDFLRELNEQIRTLQTWVEEISDGVREHTSSIASLQGKRQESLEGYVAGTPFLRHRFWNF